MTLATTAALALALFSWTGADPDGGSTAAAAATPRSPILLDFHAEWCAPCRQMRPAVAKLRDKDYPIQSIDIDQKPELARRYKITGVPTFIVVDAKGRELARSSGAQPAADLARLYNNAVSNLAAKSRTPNADTAESEAVAESEPVSEADLESRGPGILAAAETPASDGLDAYLPTPPDPWKTAVRIKIGERNRGPIGFGSGTVIYSTPEETIILTCAHIFKVEGASRQPAPRQFRIPIEVDLFDGILHGKDPEHPYLHPLESLAGEAVDYDFKSDVGLIRIRPGRILPTSPVVPATWKPKAGVKMTTVGCSEGQNASPWSTIITKPEFRGWIEGREYTAIECQHAPLQGRSGGGLYTLDGYVAGVCNFAAYTTQHGLYATPASIHRLLDRNQLTVCYNPAAGTPGPNGTLVASRNGARAPAAAARRRNDDSTLVRGQSPATSAPAFPMPGPDQLGIGLTPIEDEVAAASSARAANRPVAAAGTWQAPASQVAIAAQRAPRTNQELVEPTNLPPAPAPVLLDPDADAPTSTEADTDDSTDPQPHKARAASAAGSGWRAAGSRPR